MAKNRTRDSTVFLGIHVGEDIIENVFNNTKRMPANNKGYDFLWGCKRKLEVKTSCLSKKDRWFFNINRNKTPDYFVCIGLDTIENLNPLRIWVFPGDIINNSLGVGLSPTSKWPDKYLIGTDKAIAYCNKMRHVYKEKLIKSRN